MKVFLDSNIIIADYNLTSPHVEVLRAFLRRTNSSLLIPRIVLEEVKNHYREDLEQAMKAYWKSLERLHHLEWSLQSDRPFREKPLEKPPEDHPLVNIEKKVEGYSLYLDSRLKELNARYVDFPSVPHSSVANRAVSKRKPFSESGKGYRDTLIWESILAEATPDKEPISLITKNTKDFAAEDSNSLHQDLIEDLTVLGMPKDRVKLYSSLEGFIESHVAPLLSRLTEVEKQLTEGTFKPLSLQKFLELQEQEIVKVINEELPDLLSEPKFDEPSVENLYQPAVISSVSVYQNEENTLFIEFITNYDVDAEFFIFKADYYTLDEEEDEFSIYDSDWNEWTMRGGKNIAISADLTLIFDTTKNEVTSFKITGLNRVWDKI